MPAALPPDASHQPSYARQTDYGSGWRQEYCRRSYGARTLGFAALPPFSLILPSNAMPNKDT